MRLYVDSSDLIDLSNGDAPISVADFGELLSQGAHKAVYSLDTIIEVSAPLLTGTDPLEVRKALNTLEELPHVFINEARIRDMELREAISAFSAERDYDARAVKPFGARIDQAIDMWGYPHYVVQAIGPWKVRVATEMIVNLRIWDAIRYVWREEPESFNVHRRREQQFIELMEADRGLKEKPGLPDHFVTVLARNLSRHGIGAPAEIEALGHWVYESSDRCPGMRLAYEVHHRFLKNAGDHPHASDLIDLGRVNAAPYVDFFLTDKAMLDYCRSASRAIGNRYAGRLGRFDEAIALLTTSK